MVVDHRVLHRHRVRAVQHMAEASTTGHGTNIIAGLGVSMKSTACRWSGLPGDLDVLPAGAACTASPSPPPRCCRWPASSSPGRLRPDHRQRRRHRRKWRNWTRSAQHHRPAGCGGQHHQGGDQGLRHRFGRRWRRWCCSPTTALEAAHGGMKFDLRPVRPMVIIGLFIGGLIPYLFGAMAMEAVGRAPRVGGGWKCVASSARSRASWKAPASRITARPSTC